MGYIKLSILLCLIWGWVDPKFLPPPHSPPLFDFCENRVRNLVWYPSVRFAVIHLSFCLFSNLLASWNLALHFFLSNASSFLQFSLVIFFNFVAPPHLQPPYLSLTFCLKSLYWVNITSPTNQRLLSLSRFSWNFLVTLIHSIPLRPSFKLSNPRTKSTS